MTKELKDRRIKKDNKESTSASARGQNETTVGLPHRQRQSAKTLFTCIRHYHKILIVTRQNPPCFLLELHMTEVSP